MLLCLLAAFYGAMVRDNPTNPKGHYGYGITIINDVKRIDIGIHHLKECTRLQASFDSVIRSVHRHTARSEVK